MTADYKTLLQQKAELEAKIAATLKAEKGGVIAKVRELVEQFGLTQDDIFSTGKAKSASIGVAKYRDPASGATWTGRGKPPRWIEGKDRKALEIWARPANAGLFYGRNCLLRENVSIQLLRKVFASTGEIGFACHVWADVVIPYPQTFAVVKGLRA